MISGEMPKYKCHKEVWALKIKSIHIVNEVGVFLTPEEEGYEPVQVSMEYYSKHKPIVGGYYVLYEDGYKSFSPAKALEEGYTRIN